MTDWTSGYVADIGYTYGYYTELNPHRARLALLRNAIPCPEFGTACELGFGQGVSTNIHAAASQTKWFGTDFNPAQAGFAQELASVSGNNAELYDQAFDEFCNRSDLPDFDFIGIHGIWSWISNENREIIIDFIRRKLKVGGVVFISYNTMPGWAPFAPMRKLMTQHAEVIGAEGSGIVNRIEGALDFADKLLKTNPSFLKANPQISDRLEKLKGQNRQYLAHEYFNRDWHPVPFSDMAEAMESAKVDYACSANYLSHIDQINLTEDQSKFLATIPDGRLRQSVRDFMVNQQFRQDYWIKGLRTIHGLDHIESLHTQKVILTTYREDIPLKVACPLGEATLHEPIYNAVLEALADYQIHTIGDVLKTTEPKGVLIAQVSEALMTLAHSGHVMSVQNNSMTDAAVLSCEKLNKHLLHQARNKSVETANLASPVTGGGVHVPRIQQLFLLAIQNGQESVADIAKYVWQILDSQGEKILQDGKALEKPGDNIKYLEAHSADFLKKRFQILKNLKVI